MMLQNYNPTPEEQEQVDLLYNKYSSHIPKEIAQVFILGHIRAIKEFCYEQLMHCPAKFTPKVHSSVLIGGKAMPEEVFRFTDEITHKKEETDKKEETERERYLKNCRVL